MCLGSGKGSAITNLKTDGVPQGLILSLPIFVSENMNGVIMTQHGFVIDDVDYDLWANLFCLTGVGLELNLNQIEARPLLSVYIDIFVWWCAMKCFSTCAWPQSSLVKEIDGKSAFCEFLPPPPPPTFWLYLPQ